MTQTPTSSRPGPSRAPAVSVLVWSALAPGQQVNSRTPIVNEPHKA